MKHAEDIILDAPVSFILTISKHTEAIQYFILSRGIDQLLDTVDKGRMNDCFRGVLATRLVLKSVYSYMPKLLFNSDPELF